MFTDETDYDDVTVVDVPQEAAGYVTGAQGNFLRTIEEEWKTIMFFAEDRDSAGTSSKADRRRLNKNERLVGFLSLSLKVRTFHLN